MAAPVWKEDIRLQALRLKVEDQSPDLTKRILARLRKRFYEGREKVFYQEQERLRQCIFYPAAWLKLRGCELPAAKYEGLILEILRTIIEHADVTKIRCFSVYLLECVQSHMKIQGERYLEEGKAFEKVLFDQMQGFRKAGALPLQKDRTVETLAAAHKALAEKSGRKKKQVANGAQETLF